MPYRGDAPANATITVRLALDAGAKGNALLMAGAGAAGAGAKAKTVVVAPGGQGSVKVTTPSKGILKAVVDFSGGNDTGRLDVTAPGGFSDGDPIDRDPTNWTYSVR